MNLLAKPISFIEHVFFKVAKDDGTGYMYTKYAQFRYGLLLWSNKNKFVVIRYPILIAIALNIVLWIMVEHVLNINNTNWFTMIYGYMYSFGQLSATLTFYFRESTLTELSRALDKWWTYKDLEEEKQKIKESLERKLNKFDLYYYNLMKVSGLAYAALHAMRTVFTSSMSLQELLIFHCWSPYPLDVWWGFTLTFMMEGIIMITLLILAGRMGSYLYSAVVTIGEQFSLAGLALLTVEQRVDRMMESLAIRNETEAIKIHTRLVQQEIKEAAMHIKFLLHSAKITFEVFHEPINMYYYPGLLCTSLATVKLMSEWKNKFEVLFTIIIASITIFNLFLLCLFNQIFQNQGDKLQFVIYDCPWFNMPVAPRRDLLILQSMLIKPPSMRTILGANTDMEFLGTVFNAYYCFINAGRTMNISY